MISEGRLAGVIDQVDGYITFEGGNDPLAQWDSQVGGCLGEGARTRG